MNSRERKNIFPDKLLSSDSWMRTEMADYLNFLEAFD
jgi:hypothetical protein